MPDPADRSADPSAPDGPGLLNLKQAAALLDVHYMTAYRYVRQGRLVAHQVGTQWRIHETDLEAFRAGVHPDRYRAAHLDPDGAAHPAPAPDWAHRLVTPLLAGDEAAAWAVVDRALAGGHDPAFCYLDVIGAAVNTIDIRRAQGELTPAQQPLATAVAYRLVARLGARFRRPGRSRGAVVFGAPSGEAHHLPLAIVADLVRLDGYDVLELWGGAGPDVFAAAARQATRLAVVALSITQTDHLDEARAIVAAVRAAAPSTPVVVGGQAVRSEELGRLLDADGWAPDGRSAVEVIDRLARRARRSGAASAGPHRLVAPTDPPAGRVGLAAERGHLELPAGGAPAGTARTDHR